MPRIEADVAIRPIGVSRLPSAGPILVGRALGNVGEALAGFGELMERRENTRLLTSAQDEARQLIASLKLQAQKATDPTSQVEQFEQGLNNGLNQIRNGPNLQKPRVRELFDQRIAREAMAARYGNSLDAMEFEQALGLASFVKTSQTAMQSYSDAPDEVGKAAVSATYEDQIGEAEANKVLSPAQAEEARIQWRMNSQLADVIDLEDKERNKFISENVDTLLPDHPEAKRRAIKRAQLGIHQNRIASRYSIHMTRAEVPTDLYWTLPDGKVIETWRLMKQSWKEGDIDIDQLDRLVAKWHTRAGQLTVSTTDLDRGIREFMHTGGARAMLGNKDSEDALLALIAQPETIRELIRTNPDEFPGLDPSQLSEVDLARLAMQRSGNVPKEVLQTWTGMIQTHAPKDQQYAAMTGIFSLARDPQMSRVMLSQAGRGVERDVIADAIAWGRMVHEQNFPPDLAYEQMKLESVFYDENGNMTGFDPNRPTDLQTRKMNARLSFLETVKSKEKSDTHAVFEYLAGNRDLEVEGDFEAAGAIEGKAEATVENVLDEPFLGALTSRGRSLQKLTTFNRFRKMSQTQLETHLTEELGIDPVFLHTVAATRDTFIRMGHDPQTAMTRAFAQVEDDGKAWGWSEINGRDQYMRTPPEGNYPEMLGNHTWIPWQFTAHMLEGDAGDLIAVDAPMRTWITDSLNQIRVHANLPGNPLPYNAPIEAVISTLESAFDKGLVPYELEPEDTIGFDKPGYRIFFRDANGHPRYAKGDGGADLIFYPDENHPNTIFHRIEELLHDVDTQGQAERTRRRAADARIQGPEGDVARLREAGVSFENVLGDKPTDQLIQEQNDVRRLRLAGVAFPDVIGSERTQDLLVAAGAPVQTVPLRKAAEKGFDPNSLKDLFGRYISEVKASLGQRFVEPIEDMLLMARPIESFLPEDRPWIQEVSNGVSFRDMYFWWRTLKALPRERVEEELGLNFGPGDTPLSIHPRNMSRFQLKRLRDFVKANSTELKRRALAEEGL